MIRENAQYKMWYSGYRVTGATSPAYIGYATSSDGINWTKDVRNPVLGPGTAAWEAGGVYGCTVMPISGGYRMWYSAYDAQGISRIGYATSANGIDWRRDTLHNPVLNVGAPGQWDAGGAWFPIVLRIGSEYYMWYTGRQSGASGFATAAGIAVSSDGVTNWTRYSGNPVISPTSGAWDGTYAGVTTVLQRGDTLHMWYDGSLSPIETNPFRIGHATSPLVTSGVEEANHEAPQGFMLEQNYPNPIQPGNRNRLFAPDKEQDGSAGL